MTMDRILNAKQLRATLPAIVERVRRGERFTVLYRSHPAFRVVPVNDDTSPRGDDGLSTEPLYRAGALGRSTDGLLAADYDALLYAPVLRAPERTRRRPKRAHR
jgi:antitoxin (DNA-binding transcriptional repressor) of toxin-antitoxin stability system